VFASLCPQHRDHSGLATFAPPKEAGQVRWHGAGLFITLVAGSSV